MERSKYDMSFKYFLDMSPEEEVTDPSSLTKFRKLRLKDVELLDLLINKTVEIAVEKEIIKSNSIIVDATHSKARYNQKSPKEILMDKSKLLRKAIDQVDESIKNQFPPKSMTDLLEDEIVYCQKLMEVVEKNDGKQLETLVEKSKEAGMEVKTIIGDTAYSEKGNIDYANTNEIQLVAKLNPSVTQGFRQKEDEFEFNKDAGMYVCKAGHMAIRKARQGKKGVGKNQTDTYYIDVEKCKLCPFKEGCYKEGAKTKSYSVGLNPMYIQNK